MSNVLSSTLVHTVLLKHWRICTAYVNNDLAGGRLARERFTRWSRSPFIHARPSDARFTSGRKTIDALRCSHRVIDEIQIMLQILGDS